MTDDTRTWSEIAQAIPGALAFGLRDAIPTGTLAAWGARFIFPNDLLWDRQDMLAATPEAKAALMTWLNGPDNNGLGALQKARVTASRLAETHYLTQTDELPIALYRDEWGIVVGNPRRSHGYLYVAAFLYAHVPEGGIVPPSIDPPAPKPVRRKGGRK